MPFVYSTLTNAQRYVKYGPEVAGGVPREERAVYIEGGANVANKHFITPKGVATEVSAEDLEMLKENKLFQEHQKNGHIVIEDRKADVDKVVADMTGRSPDAPIRPEDFQLGKEYETEGTTIKAKKRK